jgi:tRNA(fMet)-specific endonuclease VapC
MRYMLDTGICSYVMKRSSPALIDRLSKIPNTEVCVSVVTKAELLYGVRVSPAPERDAQALGSFLTYVEALDLPEKAAAHYAMIRADLKRKGQLIGANDLFIAAHARSLGLVLVTNNTEEFSRVEDLALENWTE